MSLKHVFISISFPHFFFVFEILRPKKQERSFFGWQILVVGCRTEVIQQRGLSVELKNHQNHCITLPCRPKRTGNMWNIYIWVFPKIVGTPKSSILIGFSIINHPFWGTPIFGNTHIYIYHICIYLHLMVGFPSGWRWKLSHFALITMWSLLIINWPPSFPKTVQFVVVISNLLQVQLLLWIRV